MARANTPYPLHGKCGNVIFRVVNGKQVASQAPDPVVLKRKHEKMMAHPVNYGNYRLNLLEFAGASKVACNLYKALHAGVRDMMGPIFRPYAQNYLTAKIKENAAYDLKHNGDGNRHYGTEFSIRDAVHALQGLDLGNKKAPATQVEMIPIGPWNNPTAIQVLGLDRAAEAIRTNGNSRLEFRFHIRQAAYMELELSKGANPKWVEPQQTHPDGAANVEFYSDDGDWIPTEIIPSEGFTLELPVWPEHEKYVTVIIVEWREHRHVGRRLIKHHKKAIVRIVSIHAPAEALTDPSLSLSSSRSNSDPEYAESPDPLVQMDPKAYIAAILAKLKPT